MKKNDKKFLIPEAEIIFVTTDSVILTSGEYAKGRRFGFGFDEDEDEGLWLNN